jgi:hypothetical protein
MYALRLAWSGTVRGVDSQDPSLGPLTANSDLPEAGEEPGEAVPVRAEVGAPGPEAVAEPVQGGAGGGGGGGGAGGGGGGGGAPPGRVLLVEVQGTRAARVGAVDFTVSVVVNPIGACGLSGGRLRRRRLGSYGRGSRQPGYRCRCYRCLGRRLGRRVGGLRGVRPGAAARVAWVISLTVPVVVPAVRALLRRRRHDGLVGYLERDVVYRESRSQGRRRRAGKGEGQLDGCGVQRLLVEQVGGLLFFGSVLPDRKVGEQGKGEDSEKDKAGGVAKGPQGGPAAGGSLVSGSGLYRFAGPALSTVPDAGEQRL